MFFEKKTIDSDTENSLYWICFYRDQFNFTTSTLDGVEVKINHVINEMKKENEIFVIIDASGERRVPYIEELRLLWKFGCSINDDPDRFPKNFYTIEGLRFNENFNSDLSSALTGIKEFLRPATARRDYEVRFFFINKLQTLQVMAYHSVYMCNAFDINNLPIGIKKKMRDYIPLFA